MTLYPTIEVGSLPKLPGRASKLAGRAITDAEHEQVKEVLRLVPSARLAAIAKEYLALVSSQGKPDSAVKQRIIALNSSFNIALLEEIGIDYVFDGEAHRSEMYAGIATKLSGLEGLSWQVSFVNKDGDPNIFSPYMYTGKLGFRGEVVHDAEVRYVLSKAVRPVKVCVTGAYTMGTWTDAGVLLPRYRLGGMAWSEAWAKAQEQIVGEFAGNVLNPIIRNISAIDVGGRRVGRIQIDEPNATHILNDDTAAKELLLRSLSQSVKGAAGTELGLHVCFTRDYSPIAEVIAAVREMRFVTLEIANGDPGDLSNYRRVLEQFINAGYTGKYCIGIFEVHSDRIERAEEIVRRAEFATGLVGDAKRIELAPDCGLRTRVLPVAVRKLQEMVRAAELLR